MSAAPALPPAAAAAKGSANPTKAGAKAYTQLFFEYSDGKGYDVAVLRATDGTRLSLDQEGQTRWEVSLASSLKLNCGSPSDDTLYIARLPKGFQVVIDPKKGERFLIGHPGGVARDFWYRSVAEFAPHLLWLGAPGPHDRSRCSCEPCKKMLGKPRAKETKKSTAAAKRKPSSNSNSRAPSTAATAPPASAPASSVPVSASANTAAATIAAGPKPAAPAGGVTSSTMKPAASATASSRPTPAPTSTPVVAPPPPEAPPPILDHSIYRAGEMVWYATQMGVWRLGLIASRYVSGAAGPPDTWVVAPLGHVLLAQESCVKAAAQMRPFHAFSLPNIDTEQLQGKRFAQVDWPAFVQQYAGADAHRRQVAGLEASKMAARDVNSSYSTFNRLGGGGGGGGGYGGIFLGPEMVRLGDGLRVRRSVRDEDGSVDVMEVGRIQDGGGGGGLTFSGNVWRLQVSPLEAAPASPQPWGPDFCRQLETYNEVLRAQGGRVDWVLAESGAERAEADVYGRFYVTFDLLPDLRDSVVPENPPDDGTARLNVRLRPGDSFYTGRVENRRAAFGDSVGVGRLHLGPDVIEG